MTLTLLIAMVYATASKPTVSLEESCRTAAAVLVVEVADKGTYQILDVLHDGTKDGLKKGDVIIVDLGGMVYEKEQSYILFLKPISQTRRYQAVPQVRTEDRKDLRAQVKMLLSSLKAN